MTKSLWLKILALIYYLGALGVAIYFSFELISETSPMVYLDGRLFWSYVSALSVAFVGHVHWWLSQQSVYKIKEKIFLGISNVNLIMAVATAMTAYSVRNAEMEGLIVLVPGGLVVIITALLLILAFFIRPKKSLFLLGGCIILAILNVLAVIVPQLHLYL